MVSNGKKIIKVGLTKTKEKGDCMRSQERDLFYEVQRLGRGLITADDARILQMCLQAEL